MAIEIPIDNTSIVQLRRELVGLRQELQKATDPKIQQQFQAEIEKVNQKILEQTKAYDASGKSFTTLRQEAKAFQDSLGEIEDVTSETFQTFARGAGQARDGMIAINEQINQFAAGTTFEQAQLQLGGIREGLLSLNFDKVSESAANLSNTIAEAGSLKEVFGDIGGAVKNLGNVFVQLGKKLLTNPIYLLATVVAVLVVAIVSFMDKLGLLEKVIDALTAPLRMFMDLLTGITDSLGLTAVAQGEYAASVIKEGEKIREEVDRQEKQQLAFYNVTKNLTDKEIADLQEKTGVVIDTTQSEFDIREEALNKRIAQNNKEIEELQKIAKTTAGLNEDQQKQLDERLKNEQKYKDDSIQIELDRTNRIAELNRSLNDQLDRLRAQNITNEFDRNKALNDLDKQAALDRVDNQILELRRLGQSTEQAEALRAETITFYANKETQIRRDASAQAFSKAQTSAKDRLSVIENEEALKIEKINEGTAQRIIAEEAAGNRILEFQKKNAKLLGLTSDELALLEIKNRQKVEEAWNSYNSNLKDINDKIRLNTLQQNVENAKNVEDSIQAEIALEQEKYKQQVALIKQSATQRFNAAKGDQELQKAIQNQAISDLQLLQSQSDATITNLRGKQNQFFADQAALQAQTLASAAEFDAQIFEGGLNKRIELLQKAATLTKESLEASKLAELETVEGDEVAKAAILEKYRQLNAQADLDSIAKERQARFEYFDAILQKAQSGLNAIADLGNFVLDLESQNLEEGTKEAEVAAKKKFEFNKAFQLGAAVINGLQAVNASLAQSPIAIGPVPNPAGIASLAFAIATTTANIIKIASQQYKSKSTSVSGGPQPTAGSPIPQGGAVPALGLFPGQNVAPPIGGTTGPPPTTEITVKAVVVESEITETQSNIKKIQSASELGG